MSFHQTQGLERRELQDGSQQRNIDAVFVVLAIMLCLWHLLDHVAILTHAPAARQQGHDEEAKHRFLHSAQIPQESACQASSFVLLSNAACPLAPSLWEAAAMRSILAVMALGCALVLSTSAAEPEQAKLL